MQDYWSTITEGDRLYQMGPQSHRIYLLNRLRELGVESFIDVGCGTAPLYELIKADESKGQFSYKGVDPSAAMITTCKHFFPEGDFDVQNATDLQEKDSSWEAVVMMHSFDYVYDYMKALTEAHKVAKKYVVIILWQTLDYKQGSTHRLNNSVNGVELVDWNTARLQHFAADQLFKEAEEIGLKLIENRDDEEVNKEGRTNTFLLFEKI